MLPAPTMPARKRGGSSMVQSCCDSVRLETRRRSATPSTITFELGDARRPGLPLHRACSAPRRRRRRDRRRALARSPHELVGTLDRRAPVRAVLLDLGHARRHDRQPRRQVLAQLERIAIRAARRSRYGISPTSKPLQYAGSSSCGVGPADARWPVPSTAGGVDLRLADQHDAPVRAPARDVGEQLEVDPVAQRPVEAEHRAT